MILSTMGTKALAIRKAVRAGLARALAGARACPDPATAARLAEELLARSSQHRALLLRNQPKTTHPQVIRRLIAMSFALRKVDPERYLAAAQVAVEAAAALRPSRFERRLAADLRAEAWAQVANAHRVAGDLWAAQTAWRRVAFFQARGTADPQLAADLLRLKAGLLSAQRKFSQAVELLQEALDLYEQLGETHLAGRAQLILGIVHYHAGDPAEAYASTLEAIRLIDGGRDPDLALDAAHHLAGFLAECGHPATALKVMQRCDPLYRRGSPLFRLRATWLKGRLYAAERQWSEAVLCLDRVRRAFIDREMSYDAALAALDLALVHAQQMRFDSVRRLAEEMYPVFIAQDIPREASAALLLFLQAAREGPVAPDDIAQLSARLKYLWLPRGRQAPQGRFLP